MVKKNKYSIMILGDSMSDIDGALAAGYGPGRKDQSVWTKELKKQIDPRRNQSPAQRFKKYRRFEFYQGKERNGGSEMARSSVGTPFHLRNLALQLKTTSPGIVTIAISPWNETQVENGKKRRLSIQESKSNLEKLVAMAKNAGAKVLLIAFPSANNTFTPETVTYANNLASMIKDVAINTRSSIVEDYYRPIRVNGKVPQNLFHRDSLHLRYEKSIEKRLFENVMSKMAPLMKQISGKKVSVLIDLDGKGLKLSTLASSPTQFDLDGYGSVENLAWSGNGTGFVAFDHNGDSIADPEDVSFGDSDSGSNIHVLKKYDTNNNGALESTDASWKKFAVWIDANGNGVSDQGELRSLTQAGIKSIDLTLDHEERKLRGVSIHGLGTYTGVDGNKRTLGTATFAEAPDPLSNAEIVRRRDLLVQMISQNGAASSYLRAPGATLRSLLNLSPVKF